MLRCLFATLGLALFVGAVADVRAQEWTRFRGPNGTGIAPAVELPEQWTASDVRWKVALPAKGHSSPVVWGERIFLTGADEEAQKRFAYCLSAKDGSVLWVRDYPLEVHNRHKFNSLASPTPTVDEERVYFAWSTPAEYTLFALDHNGQDVWSRSLGPYQSQHSCGTSPILYQDLVVIGNDQDGPSSLFGVHKKTGEICWETKRKPAVVAYSTPCVRTTSSGQEEIVFNASSHGITAIDPKSGQTTWEVPGVFEMRSCSSPVLAGGLVFGSCGSGKGGFYLVGIRPGDSADGPSQAYKVSQGASYVPTPVAVGERIHILSDGGVVTCLDASTGQELWKLRIGGNYFASPIVIGDRLLAVSTAGEAVVLATGKEPRELGRYDFADTCHSTPAVSGGRLYIRTEGFLHALGK